MWRVKTPDRIILCLNFYYYFTFNIILHHTKTFVSPSISRDENCTINELLISDRFLTTSSHYCRDKAQKLELLELFSRKIRIEDEANFSDADWNTCSKRKATEHRRTFKWRSHSKSFVVSRRESHNQNWKWRTSKFIPDSFHECAIEFDEVCLLYFLHRSTNAGSDWLMCHCAVAHGPLVGNQNGSL